LKGSQGSGVDAEVTKGIVGTKPVSGTLFRVLVELIEVDLDGVVVFVTFYNPQTYKLTPIFYDVDGLESPIFSLFLRLEIKISKSLSRFGCDTDDVRYNTCSDDPWKLTRTPKIASGLTRELEFLKFSTCPTTCCLCLSNPKVSITKTLVNSVDSKGVPEGFEMERVSGLGFDFNGSGQFDLDRLEKFVFGEMGVEVMVEHQNPSIPRVFVVEFFSSGTFE
jgi:hypothetical protein